MNSEEYLRTCIQGEGCNEVVSFTEALFALQLHEEKLLSELQGKDTLDYLDKNEYYAVTTSFDGRCGSNVVTTNDAKEALSIQQANFEYKLREKSKDLPPDISEFINENFWDLF